MKNIPQTGLKHVNGFSQAHEIYVSHDTYGYKKVRGGFVHIKRVDVTRASATPEPGLRAAVLARTGPVPKKATEAVIFAGIADEGQWIRIPDGTDPNDGRDLVKEYLDQVTKTGKYNQKEWLGSEQGVLREGYPVMYVMEGGRLMRFFGHTQMFRMPYRHSPEGLLPGEHKDPGTLDLAQAMFGTVRGERGGAAGRVFVENARLDPKQDRSKLWLDGDPVVMPRILSGPKPTTFQHYLTQPEPDIERGKGLKTYNDVGQTTLRGHKLYWHQGNPERKALAERPLDETQKGKDTQHTRIKPVRNGVRFHFRVRFENLLAEELGLLWWAVKLPARGQFAHKIGMGKPLGLGSVRLTPALTVIEPAARYGSFLDDQGHGLTDGRVTVSAEEAAQAIETLAAKALKLSTGAPFAETPRMRALLAMLSWPGPTADKTRYMSIGIDEETNKITGTNEFKERPVLPDPAGVVVSRLR
jgi:CRISPR-associated protein (TIGR03986 family)